MPRTSSIFGFSGSPDRICFRVQLFQKGIQSLDFDRFNSDTQFDEKPTKSRLDDVTFKWRQKVGRVENSNRRIFTLRDDDDFPDYLNAFRPNIETEELGDKKNEKEYPINDHIVYRNSSATKPFVKKSQMFIFARLGPLEIQDPTAVELIARITVTDSHRLTVEPAIDQNSDEGVLLETKFGDFTAKIKIDDVEKSSEDLLIEEKVGEKPRSRKARNSVTSIPEAESFEAAKDGLVESVVNFTLVRGTDFLFTEGLTIDYKLQLPTGVRLKSDNLSGRSQRYSAEESTGILNFGYFLEFIFESRIQNFQPKIMLRIMAVDYWGRQYIAGYGSTFIQIIAGKSFSKIHLWRPISHNSLYEMFVGQAIDVDYFGIPKASKEMAGVDGQPSGIVSVEMNCVAQSKHFIARDILYQLKYGSKMADMGLRSDFYQRIIKVLMEFEEARSKLIQARALNKKKIKNDNF